MADVVHMAYPGPAPKGATLCFLIGIPRGNLVPFMDEKATCSRCARLAKRALKDAYKESN